MTVTKNNRTVRTQLAKFHPLEAQNGIRAMPKLTIGTRGVEILHHIILTALILQRDQRPTGLGTSDIANALQLTIPRDTP